MPVNPAEEFFEVCPDVKEMMLSMRDALGPFVIKENYLDRQDGDGIVKTYPDPNVTR